MTKRNRFILTAAVIFAILAILLWYSQRKFRNQAVSQNQVVLVDSTSVFWYKNSIIYSLDVEVFKDSDGDGVGDFKGLISKLPYLDSLGITAIWLSPFNSTPNKDDGYDITDYYSIDNRLGTLDDYSLFMQNAKDLNIKIIMDLVVNHTSNEHPWFKEAEEDTTSIYHKWYLWSKEQPENYDTGMIFPGVQKETWTYDSIAKEYYYHRFYDFQPDLNMQYLPVQREVKKIMKYWLEKGVNGFRLDAVPFIIEVPEKKGEKFEHQFDILTDLRKYVESIDKDAIILGEANVPPSENKNYFGEDVERMHMMFNFYVNQHMFYALATGEAKPLANALQSTKDIPKEAEWGQFLRNHDEVDLGRLTNMERKTVYKKFGPKKYMQLYDRGIRRRLAPMLNNNQDYLKLAYSLLFSLPSTPVMRYGDEIGMGDDLSLKERLAVRTPMQWNDTKNGGFSTSDTVVRPVINSYPYDYEDINVKDEAADSTSLLNWTKRMVQFRKDSPEISYGKWEIIDTDSDNILAMHYIWNNKESLIIHNLNNKSQEISIASENIEAKRLKDLVGKKTFTSKNGSYNFKLEGYGFMWLKAKNTAKAKN
ncbi:MAG: alpha-amylase family protein [Leeuwenhoekiella sp.]